MNETQRRERLYSVATTKGMSRTKVDALITLFGIDIAEQDVFKLTANDKSTAVGYKASTPMSIDDINKATTAMKQKTLRTLARFTGAKLSVQIDAAILEDMRNQVGVPQALWDVLTRTRSESDLYQLLLDAGAILPTEDSKAAPQSPQHLFWFGNWKGNR